MEASLEYWENAIPWAFKGETTTYESKRGKRYELQDYMAHDIGFESYRGRKVLEVGSGGGIDSAEFARNGAEVISLDFTHLGASTTRDLLREAGFVPNPVRSDASSLPFRDAEFDCLYSFGVLHHIPDVVPVVQEIARVLKPGGELTCMLYNKASLLYCYSILFVHRNEGLTEEQLVSRYSERILNCPYTRAYTKGEVHGLLSPYFEPINTSVRYNVIDLPDNRKFKLDIPDRYELGWHLIVKAKRR